MIDAAQIRAARALLSISQVSLAKTASVHVATIRRLEAASGVRGTAESLWKIQIALEKAGPADATMGPGVRLKHGRRGEERKREGKPRRA